MSESLATVVARLGLTVSAEFVPFSKSRNAKPDAKLSDRSLNWKVTLRHNGRDVLSTDYQAGIAHCPAYKRGNYNFARPTIEAAEAITFETEQGKAWGRGIIPGAAIMPAAVDVIYSLAMDSGALDFARFEDWASDYGYDSDSRKAESIYRECLAHALALRNAIGDAALTELRDAASEH